MNLLFELSFNGCQCSDLISQVLNQAALIHDLLLKILALALQLIFLLNLFENCRYHGLVFDWLQEKLVLRGYNWMLVLESVLAVLILINVVD